MQHVVVIDIVLTMTIDACNMTVELDER